jgi:hypothetical protein
MRGANSAVSFVSPELFSRAILGVLLDSGSGLKIGDSAVSFPGSSTLAHEDSGKTIGIFFRILFLAGLDSGLVSLRWACYRLVRAFSIPADSRATSVEYRVLEIACLDLGLGLIMGDSGTKDYSAVSTVQSSRPTRTVCSDCATGLLVSSTSTGYPPTHLL